MADDLPIEWPAGCMGTDCPIARHSLALSAENARLKSAGMAAEEIIANFIGMYGDSGAGLVLKQLRAALAAAAGDK